MTASSSLLLQLATKTTAHISYQRPFESIPELCATELGVRSNSCGGQIFNAAEGVVVLKHVLKQFLLELIVLLHGVQSRFNFLGWRFFGRCLVALKENGGFIWNSSREWTHGKHSSNFKQNLSDTFSQIHANAKNKLVIMVCHSRLQRQENCFSVRPRATQVFDQERGV